MNSIRPSIQFTMDKADRLSRIFGNRFLSFDLDFLEPMLYSLGSCYDWWSLLSALYLLNMNRCYDKWPLTGVGGNERFLSLYKELKFRYCMVMVVFLYTDDLNPCSVRAMDIYILLRTKQQMISPRYIHNSHRGLCQRLRRKDPKGMYSIWYQYNIREWP